MHNTIARSEEPWRSCRWSLGKMARKSICCSSTNKKWICSGNYSPKIPWGQRLMEGAIGELQANCSTSYQGTVPKCDGHELKLGGFCSCTGEVSTLGDECGSCWSSKRHTWCDLWARLHRHLPWLVWSILHLSKNLWLDPCRWSFQHLSAQVKVVFNIYPFHLLT